MNTPVQLKKGESALLSDIDPSLHKITVTGVWSGPEKTGLHPVDPDMCVFLLRVDGKVRRDIDFIFYNNLSSDGNAVQHKGKTAAGIAAGGDQESIFIDLEAVPFDVDKLAITLSLHNAAERQQNLTLLASAGFRISNADTGAALAMVDLSGVADGTHSAMIAFELTREGLGWKVVVPAEGITDGLFAVATGYGINVANY